MHFVAFRNLHLNKLGLQMRRLLKLELLGRGGSAKSGNIRKKKNYLSEKIFPGKYLMRSDNFRTRKRVSEIPSLGPEHLKLYCTQESLGGSVQTQ